LRRHGLGGFRPEHDLGDPARAIDPLRRDAHPDGPCVSCGLESASVVSIVFGSASASRQSPTRGVT
jgi:hypothetical protein